jgi:hypothetical protein
VRRKYILSTKEKNHALIYWQRKYIPRQNFGEERRSNIDTSVRKTHLVPKRQQKRKILIADKRRREEKRERKEMKIREERKKREKGRKIKKIKEREKRRGGGGGGGGGKGRRKMTIYQKRKQV